MKKDPKTGKSVRDYKRENLEYNSRPEQRAARSERTMARNEAIKDGTVKRGDGLDLDHRKPLSKGGTSTKSNLRTVSASSNRSFSRNADGSMKSQTSKRERKK
jgi:hypothetical protein